VHFIEDWGYIKGNTDINRDCNPLKTSLNIILPAFSAIFQ